MNSKYIAAIIILFAAVTFVSFQTGQAQVESTCPALVEQALGDLGNNCDVLDKNNACYGFNRVDATFAEEVPEDFFSQPTDRTPLPSLQTIQTAPLDEALERWGIAVMNVQANVPNTLPGQSVVFMLLGDVELENVVAPEDALELGATADVTPVTRANIRSNPSLNANVIGGVDVGTVLTADGLSADQQWLRVLYTTGPGWLNREVIDPAADISALPVITAESRTPMQSFYFSTGFGAPVCTEAPPSVLVVQGPDNVKVDITANGADITIGSTIALWLTDDDQMQLIVISGTAQVGNVIVPAGFTIFAKLQRNPDGTFNFENPGPWTGFRALTEEELGWLLPLENIPDNLLHYPIDIPTLQEIQQIRIIFTGGGNGANGGQTGPASGQADCSNFRPTSPLNGFPFGATTFYWDGAPGATSYVVNVYDANGNVINSFPVSGGTSVTGDVSGGSGNVFTWSVSALVNGQLACTTEPVIAVRAAPDLDFGRKGDDDDDGPATSPPCSC
jgi:hypothetical protein